MKIIKRLVNFIFPGLRRSRLRETWVKWQLPCVRPMPEPLPEMPLYIAGLFGSHAGVAVTARAKLREFKQQRANVYGIDLTATMGQAVTFDFSGEAFDCRNLPTGGGGTVVIHLNPPDFIVALHKLGKTFLRDKYIVGFWFWELEKLPSWWLPSLNYLHETWVGSEFIREAVRVHTDKPVKVVSQSPGFKKHSPRPFAEDGKIRVLYIFDFGSSFIRKNPIAAVKAFKLAFGNRNDAELLIKVSRPEMYPPGWEELRQEAAEFSNIRLIKDFLSQDELDKLYQESDIYLSLHRSEGFGLTILEAMNSGLECVATGWSGNMDFFYGPKCHPVNYELISVNDPQNIYPYPDCRWAEPDTNHAAEILQNIAAKVINE